MKNRIRINATKTCIMSGAALLCIAAILASVSCKGKIKPGNVEPARKEISRVTLQTVTPAVTTAAYETSGTVKAKNIGIISSRLMATVKKICAREGDRVRAGDILVYLDDSDVMQKRLAAEAGYKEAEKALDVARDQRSLADVTWQRYSKLFEEKVVSRHEFDQIETQKKVADTEYGRAQQTLERARAMQEEARAYHGFTKIRSPYAGIVTAKKIDEGSMAVPGIPIMTVEDISRFTIEVNADERSYKNLSIGMSVPVYVDSLGETRTGKISRIAPAVDPSTRTFNMEVLIGGNGLRSGLSAKVFLPGGQKETILVTRKAIVEKGQLTGIYTADTKGVISYRLVKTGKPVGDQVEVLSGIKSGDRIVVDGIDNVIDGGKLKQ
ncbi:MAG: efflux RND transporter periplasmic adaptor subunit [Syntrophorhabdaceae bacterium]|nr:efflux RND transporter periplasmic adaptor subunit [Syntrophorhabdaceae bacterium]MDD4195318.1 efflux RND transporter periplasmic adaptor subunit [Syntrophorhabdaceae bacterium]HOC45501.1 efflux RND transporter periplasmic adaptor subunit [Syntrophorhabdaceae bacterium]